MEVTPNALAWLALVAWPLIAVATFASRRGSSSLARTTAWMILLPAMFLPVRLEYKVAPGIPALDKHRMAFLAIAVALELFHPISFAERLRAHRLPRLVLVGLIASIVVTVQGNPDPLTYGPTVLPGLTTYDALSLSVAVVLDLYLPFVIGQRVFRSERDLRDLLEVLVLGGLIYVPLCAIELWFSPQLHRWFYGYHQHEFLQAMRGSGFRPMVFMSHGLSVSMFLFTALCAAVGLARARVAKEGAAGRAGVLGVALLLSKSLGASLYGAVAVPVQIWLSTRALTRVLLLISALVVAYPVYRASPSFPREQILAFFNGVSVERAASLQTRLDNEQQLLDHARERPLFGWGSWGRNQIFASWGQMISVTDGYWIILIGSWGYFGFGGFFLLMLAPLLRFCWYARIQPPRFAVLLSALAVALAFSLLDLIPNSRSDNIPVVFAGALLSLVSSRRRAALPIGSRRGQREEAGPVPRVARRAGAQGP